VHLTEHEASRKAGTDVVLSKIRISNPSDTAYHVSCVAASCGCITYRVDGVNCAQVLGQPIPSQGVLILDACVTASPGSVTRSFKIELRRAGSAEASVQHPVRCAVHVHADLEPTPSVVRLPMAAILADGHSKTVSLVHRYRGDAGDDSRVEWTAPPVVDQFISVSFVPAGIAKDVGGGILERRFLVTISPRNGKQWLAHRIAVASSRWM
jgi:hypothetical protein